MPRFEFTSAERWLAYTHGMDSLTVFHHPQWLRVLERQYALKGAFLSLLDESGGFLAGIPVVLKRVGGCESFRSLPFTDYVSPLLKNSIDLGTFSSLIIDYLRDNQISAEMRWSYNGPGWFEKRVGYVHRTPLDKTEDGLFRSFLTTDKKPSFFAKSSSCTIWKNPFG